MPFDSWLTKIPGFASSPTSRRPLRQLPAVLVEAEDGATSPSNTERPLIWIIETQAWTRCLCWSYFLFTRFSVRKEKLCLFNGVFDRCICKYIYIFLNLWLFCFIVKPIKGNRKWNGCTKCFELEKMLKYLQFYFNLNLLKWRKKTLKDGIFFQLLVIFICFFCIAGTLGKF